MSQRSQFSFSSLRPRRRSERAVTGHVTPSGGSDRMSHTRKNGGERPTNFRTGARHRQSSRERRLFLASLFFFPTPAFTKGAVAEYHHHYTEAPLLVTRPPYTYAEEFSPSLQGRTGEGWCAHQSPPYANLRRERADTPVFTFKKGGKGGGCRVVVPAHNSYVLGISRVLTRSTRADRTRKRA